MEHSYYGHTRQRHLEIGARFFRLRDYTPIPLLFLVLIFAEPSVGSATLGCILVFLGELLRIYGVAFIGGVSRTRTASLGSKLVTAGPFAIVRNPLYVGNFLITLGLSIFSGVFWLILVAMILFSIQYYFIVLYEESQLFREFGDEYETYCQAVPRWIPGHIPSLDELLWPESCEHALRSERRTLTAIALVLALLVLCS